jgi:hypothetical protein
MPGSYLAAAAGGVPPATWKLSRTLLPSYSSQRDYSLSSIPVSGGIWRGAEHNETVCSAQSYVRSGTGLQSARDSCRGIGILTCLHSFVALFFFKVIIVLTPSGSS